MVYLPTTLGDFWDKCRYIFQHHGAFGIIRGESRHFGELKPQKKTGYCQRWGEKSWEELQHGAPLAHQATHFVMFSGNSKQQMQRSPGQERQLVLEVHFSGFASERGNTQALDDMWCQKHALQLYVDSIMDSSIHHFGTNQPYISQLEWFVHPHEKTPAFPSEITIEDGAFQVEEEGGAESCRVDRRVVYPMVPKNYWLIMVYNGKSNEHGW